MKIRQGFVSNSSSSSFIVAFKKEKPISTKVKIEMEIDLATYGTVFDNIKDLQCYYTEKYKINFKNPDEEDYCIYQYRKAEKAINDGKIIILGNFCSDSGEAVEYMLYELGLKKILKDENIEVIENER